MAGLRERWRLVTTVALLALLLSPAVRPGDGVPLSSYPMYASPRSAAVEFVVARGFSAAGDPVRLSISQTAATSDPLIAETRLRSEVAAGRGDALCREIAGRVRSDEVDEVVEVEVRTERHDVVAQVQGHPSLLTAETVARCRP